MPPTADEADAAADAVDAARDEIDDDDVTADRRRRPLRPAARRPSRTPAEDDDADGAGRPTTPTPTTSRRRRSARRDAALVPLIVASARKLKRVLADEQNEVLDALRRKEPVRDLDALVPRRRRAGRPLRRRHRRRAGRAPSRPARRPSAGTAPLDLGPAGTLAAGARAPRRRASSAPLRERLERGVAEGDGDNDAIAKRARGVYREWKTQRIDEQLDDVFRLAYCRGRLRRRSPPGTPVHLDRRPRRPAVAGLRGQRPGRRRRRSATPFPSGHTCAADAPRVPLPLGRRSTGSVRARAARLGPPPAARGGGSRAAPILIAVGVLFLVVVVFGRAVARFYVDYLWHDGLGRADVFWGVIRAKVDAVRDVLRRLRRARRRQPARSPTGSSPTPVPGQRAPVRRALPRAVRAPPAAACATPAPACSPSWSPCRRRRSGSRGCCSATASRSACADAQFGADVGFYVFELPFLGFVLDWLFIAMVLVLLLTVLAHVLNGGVVFASPMPSVRPATKGHIAVLLAVLAALKAADYWVSRYETTNERRGFVQGATYAVVNAQLPALMLLMLIALLTAGLFLATLRRASWRLPLIASALWLVVLVAGGLRLPGARPVARRQPQPAVPRGAVHRPQRRGHARGDGHQHRRGRRRRRRRSAGLTAADVESDLDPLRNVRLLNPSEMLSRFRIDRGPGGRADDRRPRRRPLRRSTARCSRC